MAKSVNGNTNEEQEVQSELYSDAAMEELGRSLEELSQIVPAESYQPVAQAHAELHRNMKNFTEAENTYGPQPNTWNEYKPQHQEIKDNVADLEERYQDNRSEDEKREAAKKTIGSMNFARDFFQQQSQLLLEQDRKFQQKFAEINQQLLELQKIVRPVQASEQAPENIANCLASAEQFLRILDDARAKALVIKQPHTAKMYQSARTVISDVYQNIKETHGQIKEAVKAKAYGLIDRGIRHITGYFDRGIDALQKKRAEFLNLSPLEKEREQTQTVSQVSDTEQTQLKSKIPEKEQAQPAAQVSEPEQNYPAAQVSEKDHAQETTPLSVIAATINKNLVSPVAIAADITRSVVDLLANKGYSDTQIIDTFTNMKVTAMTLLRQPQYKNIRSQKPAVLQR